MTGTAWSESVERARLATVKTFEGRMEAAAASFEQIPPHGANAHGRTLSQFAEEAGLAYSSLAKYREIWEWLEHDFAYVGKIGSYSIAYEAMLSGRWSTGDQFAGFIRSTPPPTWNQKGYQPHTFTSWTVDALRVHLGKTPTNTTLVALKAAEEGREPTPDEGAAATVKDHLDEATDGAKKIKNPTVTGKLAGAASTTAENIEGYHLGNATDDAPAPPDPAPSPGVELLNEATSHLAVIKDHVSRLMTLAQRDGWESGDREKVAESARQRATGLTMVAEVFDDPASGHVPDTIENLMGEP